MRIVFDLAYIPSITGPPRIPVLKLKNPLPPLRKNPENSHCLSSLIITVSAILARFIRPAFPNPYAVFMGRDVGYCVLSVLIACILSSANSNCELMNLFVGLPLTSNFILVYSFEYLNEYSSTR